MYWAEELANQDKDAELKARFTPVAEAMASNASNIVSELNDIQGAAVNIGGYYEPTDNLANTAMRPNTTLNSILATIK